MSFQFTSKQSETLATMHGADVTSSGRLFQTLGPAEANGRSPAVTSRDGRLSSRLEDADLNRLRDGMSATRCSSSDKYRGAVPLMSGSKRDYVNIVKRVTHYTYMMWPMVVVDLKSIDCVFVVDEMKITQCFQCLLFYLQHND